jgi:UDP-N-acetylglucosamine 2-epimerase
MYRRCSAIVGNSSSIVTESTFLHVPGLLIGPRHDLRTIGDNILRVKASFGAVQRGLAHVLYDPEFALRVAQAPSIYGDGNAAKRIAKIIASLNFGPELLQKMMPY